VTTTAVPLISKSDNGVFAWATLTPAIGWEETVSAETVPASAYVWREEHASKLVLDTSDPWTPSTSVKTKNPLLSACLAFID